VFEHATKASLADYLLLLAEWLIDNRPSSRQRSGENQFNMQKTFLREKREIQGDNLPEPLVLASILVELLARSSDYGFAPRKMIMLAKG